MAEFLLPELLPPSLLLLLLTHFPLLWIIALRLLTRADVRLVDPIPEIVNLIVASSTMIIIAILGTVAASLILVMISTAALVVMISAIASATLVASSATVIIVVVIFCRLIPILLLLLWRSLWSVLRGSLRRSHRVPWWGRRIIPALPVPSLWRVWRSGLGYWRRWVVACAVGGWRVVGRRRVSWRWQVLVGVSSVTHNVPTLINYNIIINQKANIVKHE